jgi:hypothetical protein
MDGHREDLMSSLVRLLATALLPLTLAACGGGDAAQGSGDPGLVRPVPCASSDACKPTEVCTTEDGVCNPPPGCRPGMICPAVCYGTCRPRMSPCATDADCRAAAVYCTGCTCLALSLCEKDPVCGGPGVACFADPCLNREAYCNAGRCALRPATGTCPPERCGPPLGMPNLLCPDGKTVAGPTGRCLQRPGGACGWEVATCPDAGICPAR